MNDLTTSRLLRCIFAHGVVHWQDADSDVRRLVYVYSHPLIIICLMSYAICFTPYFSEVKHFALVATMVDWVDGQFGIPTLFSEQSAFPDISKVFFGLWFFQMPLMTVFLAPRLWLAERNRWQRHWGTKSLLWQFGMIFFLPVIFLISIMGALIPVDPSFCNGCTTHSRVGLFVIYGAGVPGLFAFLIAAIPSLIMFFVKSVIDTYRSRRN